MRPCAVDDNDGVDGGLDDGSPSRFARAELLLELHSRRQVVQYSRELPLPLNRHFPDRQMQREDGAVTPHTLYIPSDPDDPGVPFPEVTLEVAIVFVAIGLRHEHGHVPPHDLGFGVPEQLLGGGVECFNVAVGVDDDNAIHG